MKRVLILFAFMLSFVGGILAQESTKPQFDTEIVRRCSVVDVEGKLYENVVITLKSTSPDYLISDKYKVKVTITDTKGKKVWKKTFKNAYLYIFSNGQVQVGKPNFDQILIQKENYSDKYLGKIREKEGIY